MKPPSKGGSYELQKGGKLKLVGRTEPAPDRGTGTAAPNDPETGAPETGVKGKEKDRDNA